MHVAARPAPRQYRSSGLLAQHFLEIPPNQLRGQSDGRVVLRRVLELLQVVQPAGLVDPVGGRDQARGLVGAGIEMLVDVVWRYLEVVAGCLLVALQVGLRRRVMGVCDSYLVFLVL